MTKVLVLMGGISTEREVSLRSGVAVAEALAEKNYEVKALDITKDSIGKIQEINPDVVFIALHGKGGEDGCIQGMLEWMGYPYTGPGVAASAICMDKILTKKILVNKNIKTPEFMEFDSVEDSSEKIKEAILKKIKFPVVLKASCQGSSIGVSIVNSEEVLEKEIIETKRYGDSLLVEEFIKGTEVTVPIIGNNKLTALPVIEITSENEFYDYQSKYTQGMCQHIIPARIDEKTYKETEKIALDAYKALGCRGMSRVDIIIDEENIPYVIEVNTVPGMTSMSLFPDSARYAGMEFSELLDTIVKLALEK